MQCKFQSPLNRGRYCDAWLVSHFGWTDESFNPLSIGAAIVTLEVAFTSHNQQIVFQSPLNRGRYCDLGPIPGAQGIRDFVSIPSQSGPLL